MTENEEENVEAEAEAEAAPTPDNEQDKVKPVVFIGLFITALLGLGKLGDLYLVIISIHLSYVLLCRDL
jgi:hypothetical protein